MTTTTTTLVRIEDLISDRKVQIRSSEHRETVDRYAEAIENLPPILVYEVDGRLIVADGFHRLAAHRRSGRDEIPAEVRSGTWDDVMTAAVTENCRNADALTAGERDRGIRRLRELHPEWSNQELARQMSVSHDTVRNILGANWVREQVPEAALLPTRVLSEIASASAESLPEVAKAAVRQNWTAQKVREVVDELESPEVTAERRTELLGGPAPQLDTVAARLAARNQRPNPEPAYDDDHAERLNPVRVTGRLVVKYKTPSTKTRTRGGRTYAKEDVTIERVVPFDLVVSEEALEPEKGLVTLANQVAKAFYADLRRSGWPVPFGRS